MSTDLIREVVEARERAAKLRAAKDEAYVAWEEAHAELIGTVKQAVEQQTQAEEALRQAALAEWVETGSKSPIPGCGIRLRQKLLYDPEKALAWAHEHHQALSLNVKEFEALMKAMVLMPSFVKAEEDVVATIAQDLGKVLEGVK